jgi:hypothetical protein
MPAHEKKVEQNYGKSKSVVILRTLKLVEALSLKLGGVKSGTPTSHKNIRFADGDLKRVTVNKGCEGVIAYQDA